MPPAVPLGLSQNDVTSRRVTFLHLAVTLGDVTFPHVMWLKPGACMLIVSNYDRRTDQVIAVAVLFLLMRENWCRCDREIVMAAVAQVQLLCHGSHVVKRKCQSKCCVSSFAFLDYRYLFNSILFYIDSNYQIILLSVISISGHYWWLFVCVSISYHGYFCLVSWMFLSQDCMALQFASDDLRADREVILRATYFKDHFLPPACFQTYSWVWTSVFFRKQRCKVRLSINLDQRWNLWMRICEKRCYPVRLVGNLRLDFIHHKKLYMKFTTGFLWLDHPQQENSLCI